MEIKDIPKHHPYCKYLCICHNSHRIEEACRQRQCITCGLGSVVLKRIYRDASTLQISIYCKILHLNCVTLCFLSPHLPAAAPLSCLESSKDTGRLKRITKALENLWS